MTSRVQSEGRDPRAEGTRARLVRGVRNVVRLCYPGIMVRIRPARLSDASTIADIQIETWRDTYTGLIPDRTLLGLSRTSHIENWRGILRDTRGHNITRVRVVHTRGTCWTVSKRGAGRQRMG